MSHAPSCFESVLRVTIMKVQVSQVCLEHTGTSGPFEMMASPLEFLSSVKWTLPRLEVRQQWWDSLSDEAGKPTLLSG